MASIEEIVESLKYQTLSLKVPIHCEGCKKKVKKVLQSIEGVYKTMIDSQQQKVTVTGNVDADTLIRKLLKNGKHAELWPEKKPTGQNPSSGGTGKKNKKKGGGGDPAPAEKTDDSKNSQPVSDEDSSSGEALKNSASNEDKKSNNKESGAAASPPEKPVGDESDKPLVGGSGKKKGKKVQTNNPPSTPGGAAATVPEGKQGTEVPSQLPAAPAYHFPEYPTQPPSYVLSYNAVQPAASYGGAAFYPPAMHHSNILYSAHQPATGTLYIPTMASAPPGSHDFFSEESDNACAVM